MIAIVSHLFNLVDYDNVDIEEEFEDTKWVIRIRISKKNRQHRPNEKVLKDNQRSIKHTYKTKNRVTRTPLNRGVNPCAPDR